MILLRPLLQMLRITNLSIYRRRIIGRILASVESGILTFKELVYCMHVSPCSIKDIVTCVDVCYLFFFLSLHNFTSFWLLLSISYKKISMLQMNRKLSGNTTLQHDWLSHQIYIINDVWNKCVLISSDFNKRETNILFYTHMHCKNSNHPLMHKHVNIQTTITLHITPHTSHNRNNPQPRIHYKQYNTKQDRVWNMRHDSTTLTKAEQHANKIKLMVVTLTGYHVEEHSRTAPANLK